MGVGVVGVGVVGVGVVGVGMVGVGVVAGGVPVPPPDFGGGVGRLLPYEEWCVGRLTGWVAVRLRTGVRLRTTGGAGFDVVVGADERRCACVAGGGGDGTATLAAGGEGAPEPGPEPEPIPIDRRWAGRLPVPESRIRAIAAPPSTSATSGGPARRASAQIARPLPRSLADNGPSSPFRTALLGLDPEI